MVRKIKKAIKKPLLGLKTEEVGFDKAKRTKIRVIGIGGGGGNVISELAQRVKKATFLAANTDLKALREVSRKVKRFSFGENVTHGLGTGMNPELGELAAQNEKEKIKKILEGQDFLIIIACLGGGVGSGAAQIFAKISRNLGNLTYGIFTLPFKFEGEKKMEIAREALEKIRTKLNAISVIPNERIFQIVDRATPLKGALSAVNKKLADSLEGLIEIIYEPGLINIDFADLRTILEGRGRLAYLNTAKAPKGEGEPKEAIEGVLNSPLYPYGIRGAKGVLYNIAGEKELSLSEVGQISKTIHDLLNKEAKIIFGISQGKKYQNIIKTTILATGCGPWPVLRSSILHRLPKVFRRKTKKLKIKQRKVRKKLTSEIKTRKTKKKPTSKYKTGRGAKKTKKKFKAEVKTQNEGLQFPTEKIKKEGVPNSSGEIVTIKIRKNALQIKKEAEAAEKEMLEKEKFWETPAFLRKKFRTE
jgi:cell division protein FtsZ